MELLIAALIYVFVAWPFYLGCTALARRAEDKWARQAFVFAFTAAWPVSLILAASLLILLLIAALWLAATWRWRRETP